MANKNQYTTEEKSALKEANSLINELVKNHGQQTALWAIRRVMDNIRSLARLAKQEKRLESELKEVRAKINFD